MENRIILHKWHVQIFPENKKQKTNSVTLCTFYLYRYTFLPGDANRVVALTLSVTLDRHLTSLNHHFFICEAGSPECLSTRGLFWMELSLLSTNSTSVLLRKERWQVPVKWPLEQRICTARGFLGRKAMILPGFLCTNIQHLGNVINEMCVARRSIKNLTE